MARLLSTSDQNPLETNAPAPDVVPEPVSRPTPAVTSARWSDAEPRPGSDHWVSTTTANIGRPALKFPTGGHKCRLYRAVCGFYECSHGHVVRIQRSFGETSDESCG